MPNGITAAVAQPTTVPGEQVGLAAGAPLPDDIHAVDTFTSRRTDQPFSPDFNLIEMAFSQLEALLRKAAERTAEGLGSAIGQLIDTVTPDGCARFFAAAGYDPDSIENDPAEDGRLIEPASSYAVDRPSRTVRFLKSFRSTPPISPAMS